MNTTQTLEQMRELKLTGMLHSYQSQLELSINHQLEGHELIAHLLQAENLYRSNARLITLLHAAKLRFHAIPESIECSAARNLSKTQGSYLKFLNNLEKIPLIIIDDFGLQALNKNMKLALLQIMEDRYAKKSLIVTSQLPVANWYEYLDEPTLADAIMDRMTAKSHRIELKGESRRKKK